METASPLIVSPDNAIVRHQDRLYLIDQANLPRRALI